MRNKKTKPWGNQFEDAQKKFTAKYSGRPKLLSEVNDLLNKLQMWQMLVFLTTTHEILKREPVQKADISEARK